jgi:hypothetical protein
MVPDWYVGSRSFVVNLRFAGGLKALVVEVEVEAGGSTSSAAKMVANS